jgi:hypothetical protein
LSHCFVAALAASCLLATGCDLSGEYEKRAQKAIQDAGARAVFDQYVHASPTPANDAGQQPTGVTIRLPKVIDAESKTLTAEPRAQPPFVALPGFSYAMERLLDDASGAFAPVYVYFAAAPKADHKLDALQATVARQVSSALPGASWSDVQLKTPEGQTVALKRLRGEGMQDFDNTAQQKEVARLDGRFDLYLVDAPNHHVLIGFRAPKDQAAKYQWEAATEASMGTVQVSGAAAAPAEAAPAAPAG